MVVCFILVAVSTYSNQLTVPGQYSKIQSALDAAANGDEIIVSPGTYKENVLQFRGKDVIVRSTDPSDASVVASTIIDAESKGIVFYLNGQEPASSAISGLTITRGRGVSGGGIYGNGALTTIEYCVISTNTANGAIPYGIGGGLYNCDGLIQNNIITANTNTAYSGTGAGLAQCDGTIRNNIITRNAAIGAQSKAGGVYGCNGMIERNLIADNVSTGTFGIGAGLYYCGGTIQNNIIVNNVARGYAGLDECDGVIRNNTIVGNRSNSSPGGGISFCDGTIINNIIWGNSGTTDPQIYYSYGQISYCCVEGGYYGTGNIANDPQFVDAPGGDFHLQAASPCVDAGGSVALTEDFEDHPRPFNGSPEQRGDGSDVDIGADEYYEAPVSPGALVY